MDTNNYPAYSYPDSNTSSPRSRDLDYDNPPQSSFDDQTFSKVKFMVSYGGKIKPRSHDNFLSYLGGDTKILSVDRNIKFTSFYSKLASVVSPDMTSFAFKYQLPGEDLDALISVTNDDDLELMMQEFDRVMRGSIKVSSARLRLFLFTDQQVTGSGDGRFGSANSETRILTGPVCEPVRDTSRVLAPTPIPPLPMPVPLPVQSTTADFLFGLDRMSVQVPGATTEQELVNQMNRLQISAQEVHQKLQLQNQQKQSAAMYPPKNEDSFADPYQKSGYWQTVEQSNQPPQHQLQAQHHQQLQQLQQQQQIQQQQLQQQQQQQQQQKQQQQQQQQPVYLVHPAQQTNAYQAQSMIRPNQGGNYSVQQQQQPVYSTPAGAQIIMQGESAAYAKQKAYENSVSGRHVFYAPGQQAGVVAMSAAPSYPAMSAGPAVVMVSGADVRSGSGDGKIVHKITAASPATV
ncbi:uncharacterized protein LOC141646341 [Silene latifolia]|uniref:uncharacterized protein LOC141646341 n=1 Tax=Silene latifolia TaxID=37657 RepID=UPI003D785AAA